MEAISREARDGDLRAAVAQAGEAEEGTYLRVMGPGGAVVAPDPSWGMALSEAPAETGESGLCCGDGLPGMEPEE